MEHIVELKGAADHNYPSARRIGVALEYWGLSSTCVARRTVDKGQKNVEKT